MKNSSDARDEFEDKIGRRIREDLLKVASQMEVPSAHDQWQEFAKSHRLPKKRKNWFKKASLTAAAILLLAITVSLLKPATASAFGERLINSIKVFLGGSLYNVNTTQEGNPPPPVVKRNESPVEKEMTLDEIEKTVRFSIARPEYLPQGAELQKVSLTQATGDMYTIKMQYTLNNQSLILIQNNTTRDYSSSFLYDSDDAQVEKIALNGREGYLIRLKDGSKILRWTMRGLELELIAKVNEEELLKIAKSIR